MDLEDFFYKCGIIIVVLIVVVIIGFLIWLAVFPSTSGNRTLLDTKFTFNKAITYLNGDKMELEIDKWSDYDGEQIQIITKDGTVYLLSTYNTILIGK